MLQRIPGLQISLSRWKKTCLFGTDSNKCSHHCGFNSFPLWKWRWGMQNDITICSNNQSLIFLRFITSCSPSRCHKTQLSLFFLITANTEKQADHTAGHYLTYPRCRQHWELSKWLIHILYNIPSSTPGRDCSCMSFFLPTLSAKIPKTLHCFWQPLFSIQVTGRSDMSLRFSVCVCEI